jgi:hypothetical protein
MEKYAATRMKLEADISLHGKMELVPSPVRSVYEKCFTLYTSPHLLDRLPHFHARVYIPCAQRAELVDVLAVHEGGYVSRVMECGLTDKEARAIGFPMVGPARYC